MPVGKTRTHSILLKRAVITVTDKQKRFVEEYLIDLNATQAAIRAGYSLKDPGKHAYMILRTPAVRTAVDQAIAERSRRTGINQDRVVRELARAAFLNPADVIDLDGAAVRKDASPEDTACIASVKVKTTTAKGGGTSTQREIRLCDKLKALELLGRHLGMFNGKLNLEGVVPVVISGAEQLED